MTLARQQLVVLIVTVLVVALILATAGLVLFPFIVALLMALLLHPLHRRMRSIGLSSTISALLNTAAATVCTVGVIFGVIPFFADEIAALGQTLVEQAQRAFETIGELWGEWLPGMRPLSETLEERAGDAASSMDAVGSALLSVISAGGLLATLLLLAFMVPMALFFFLKEGRAFREAALRLLPRPYQAPARDLALTVGDGLGDYLRGQGVVCAWQAVFHALGLALIGLQFGVLIGILTGIAAIVPVIGNLVMFSVAMLIALAQFDSWVPVFLVIVVFALANVLDTVFLVPFFIGGRIRVHPLMMILAVLLGGQLFGLVGALLALPGATVIITAGRWAWERYERTDLYSANTEEPEPDDRAKAA